MNEKNEELGDGHTVFLQDILKYTDEYVGFRDFAHEHSDAEDFAVPGRTFRIR